MVLLISDCYCGLIWPKPLYIVSMAWQQAFSLTKPFCNGQSSPPAPIWAGFAASIHSTGLDTIRNAHAHFCVLKAFFVGPARPSLYLQFQNVFWNWKRYHHLYFPSYLSILKASEITLNKSQKLGANLFYLPCVNLCQLSFNVRVIGQIGPYRITPVHHERQYSKPQRLHYLYREVSALSSSSSGESFFPDISSLSHSSFVLWGFFPPLFRTCHGTSKPTPHILSCFFILFGPCSCWNKTSFEAPKEAEGFLSLFVCIRSVHVF